MCIGLRADTTWMEFCVLHIDSIWRSIGMCATFHLVENIDMKHAGEQEVLGVQGGAGTMAEKGD